MEHPSLAAFVLAGKFQHRSKLMGQELCFSLFPVGTRETILRQTSGLDNEAKTFVTDVLELAFALQSIGTYDFNKDFDERLKFIRTLDEPVFKLFVDELSLAKLERIKEFNRLQADIKKSSPGQL